MSRRDEFGFGLQSSLEVANDQVSFSPPITSGGMSPDRSDMDIDETLGSRAPGPQAYGGKVFNGPVEGALRPNSAGGFFSTAWGPPISSIQPDAMNAPSVWEHEWDPLIADPLFATVWTKAMDPNPPVINKFIGAITNEFSINVEANNYLLYTANMVARELLPDPAVVPSMTRETLPKWPFTDVSVLLGVEGAAPTEIKSKSWSLEFNNQIVTDEFILGSALVDSFPLGDIEMNATFQPTRDIATHNRRAMADTPELIQLILRCSGRTIGTTTYRYTLDIELGALETIEAEVPLNGGETLRDVEVNCRGILNESTNKLLVAKLTNSHDGSLYVAPVAA